MGFWWFMLASVVLIPVIMIFSGRMMNKHCPKKINALMGYRTTRSMKNIDTWKFANQYCGRLYEKIGWYALPLAVLAMLPQIDAAEDVVGIAGAVICSIQCVGLLVPIIAVERALKKTFNDDGTRR